MIAESRAASTCHRVTSTYFLNKNAAIGALFKAHSSCKVDKFVVTVIDTVSVLCAWHTIMKFDSTIETVYFGAHWTVKSCCLMSLTHWIVIVKLRSVTFLQWILCSLHDTCFVDKSILAIGCWTPRDVFLSVKSWLCCKFIIFHILFAWKYFF